MTCGPLLLGLLLTAAPAVPQAPTEAEPPADSPLRQRARWVGITGGAVAATGAALWVAGEWRERSFPRDRALTPDESKSLRRAEHLSTGGFATVMTGAAVLGIAWLLWAEADRESDSAPRLSLIPSPGASAGRGGLFLELEGRF